MTQEQPQGPSLARASGSMAVATIVSRASGLLSKLLLMQLNKREGVRA